MLIRYFLWISVCTTYCGYASKNLNYRKQPTYKAAVVEFEADKGSEGLSPEQILWKNVEAFEILIKEASEQDTDIIVFPEYGLTSLIFSTSTLQVIPEVGQNACIGNESVIATSEIIHHLACAARFGQIYVVINLAEVSPANGSTGKNESRYNTAVVIDREGAILARYRKYNLYGEPQFDLPNLKLVTFRTDFDIEFGIFICFDLMFEQPAKQLVANGVTHFVYPTAWVDELPFLTAVQAQEMWASSSNVTLLAAGYHLPSRGKLGSGIYAPSGAALNYTYGFTSGTKIIYACVPKTQVRNVVSAPAQADPGKVFPEDQNLEWDYYRENLANYTLADLPEVTNESFIVSACDGAFCCHVTYRMALDENCLRKKENGPRYKLIVLDGKRKFSASNIQRLIGLQLCGVVRCLNETVQSCAEFQFPPDVSSLPSFDSIHLLASPFVIQGHSQPGFTALDANLGLVSPELFEWRGKDSDSVSLGSNLVQGVPFQTLALFHRVFSRDEL